MGGHGVIIYFLRMVQLKGQYGGDYQACCSPMIVIPPEIGEQVVLAAHEYHY